MIENEAWKNILATAGDISVVCEIYDADQTPSDDGFDPNDALDCFAAVADDGTLSFMGVEYKRLVKKFGNINRTITKEKNTASVEFSNLSREISQFEFSNGFEGLIMVVRLISRGQSVSLATSQILFTGRCEKPSSGNKDSLTVMATWILGGREVKIPRRKFTKEDQEGRVSTDPEFEGFLFLPRYGSTSFVRVEKRGGFLGWWNKKIVRGTTQWSNYSNIDPNKCLPEVLGRAQLQSVLIGAVDVGTALQSVNAFCEGEIYDFQNVRSADPAFPLSGTNYSEHLGLVGAANGDNPTYVAPGYYSRTALVRVDVLNSSVEVNDAPPDIVGIVLGRLMLIPDETGDWVLDDEWTDNAAAHVRFLITNEDYFNLDSNWVEVNDFAEGYFFNDAYIADRSLTDFLYVPEG